MRVKAGDQLSDRDAQVLDFGAGYSFTENDGHVAVSNGGLQPDIVIVPDGAGGSTATALTSGVTISGITSGDSATVFQNAINALAIQNGGKGGGIFFKGLHTWSSTVTLYPGVSLIGTGPNGNKTTQKAGSQIACTNNGTGLLITGKGASNRYFPFLSNFEIYGVDANTTQDLIVLDNTGGDVPYDVFLDHVTIFDAGRYGVSMPVSTSDNVKLWMDGCYLEGCQADGMRIMGGAHVAITNSYIFGQVNYGIYCDNTNSTLYVQNNRIWSNGSGAIFAPHIGQVIISGNHFDQNGSNTSATPQVMLKNVPFLNVDGNLFSDSRGTPCIYHMRLSQGGGIGIGSVTCNTFGLGGTTQKIYKDYIAGDKLIIANNPGFNDAFGKVASPFQGSHISFEGGGSAAPTASTDYRCAVTPLRVNFTGGTGVSITIKDPPGNTVTSGLSTYDGYLPCGYTINFGAFSVAPTVYVGVA